MAGPVARVERIGREGEPVVVIDDFAADPDALRAAAAEQAFAADGTYYPGVKAPVTDSWFDACGATLVAVLRDVFGYGPAGVSGGAWYQLVTTPPAALSLVQRLPHVDATAPDRVALVHMLTRDDHGGTGFFRHRATGFETITPARGPSFQSALSAETARTPPAAAYLADGAPWFERIAAVAPAYNRAVIYRSRLLHCGLIAADAPLSADPRAGRLTVGGFFANGGRTAR